MSKLIKKNVYSHNPHALERHELNIQNGNGSNILFMCRLWLQKSTEHITIREVSLSKFCICRHKDQSWHLLQNMIIPNTKNIITTLRKGSKTQRRYAKSGIWKRRSRGTCDPTKTQKRITARMKKTSVETYLKMW